VKVKPLPSELFARPGAIDPAGAEREADVRSVAPVGTNVVVSPPHEIRTADSFFVGGSGSGEVPFPQSFAMPPAPAPALPQQPPFQQQRDSNSFFDAAVPTPSPAATSHFNTTPTVDSHFTSATPVPAAAASHFFAAASHFDSAPAVASHFDNEPAASHFDSAPAATSHFDTADDLTAASHFGAAADPTAASHFDSAPSAASHYDGASGTTSRFDTAVDPAASAASHFGAESESEAGSHLDSTPAAASHYASAPAAASHFDTETGADSTAVSHFDNTPAAASHFDATSGYGADTGTAASPFDAAADPAAAAHFDAAPATSHFDTAADPAGAHFGATPAASHFDTAADTAGAHFGATPAASHFDTATDPAAAAHFDAAPAASHFDTTTDPAAAHFDAAPAASHFDAAPAASHFDTPVDAAAVAHFGAAPAASHYATSSASHFDTPVDAAAAAHFDAAPTSHYDTPGNAEAASHFDAGASPQYQEQTGDGADYGGQNYDEQQQQHDNLTYTQSTHEHSQDHGGQYDQQEGQQPQGHEQAQAQDYGGQYDPQQGHQQGHDAATSQYSNGGSGGVGAADDAGVDKNQWISKYDEGSGYYYFVNTVTFESAWELPAGGTMVTDEGTVGAGTGTGVQADQVQAQSPSQAHVQGGYGYDGQQQQQQQQQQNLSEGYGYAEPQHQHQHQDGSVGTGGYSDVAGGGGYSEADINAQWQQKVDAMHNRDPTGRPAHALAAFGFGGRLVTMFPQPKASLNVLGGGGSSGSYAAGTTTHGYAEATALRKGPVKIYSTKDVCGNGPHAACLSAFPGPLLSNAHYVKGQDEAAVGNMKARVVKFIDQHSEQYYGPGGAGSSVPHMEDMRILWRVLRILVEHDGILGGGNPGQDYGQLDPASAECQLIALFDGPDAADTVFDEPDPSAAAAGGSSSAQQQLHIEQALLQGDRKTALDLAINAGDWAKAILLASFIRDGSGQETYRSVVSQFVESTMPAASPMRTVFMAHIGKGASAIKGTQSLHAVNGNAAAADPSQAIVMNWKRHVQVVLANAPGGQADTLKQLGDKLWMLTGNVAAAHVCYVLAGAHIESVSQHGCRVHFLGVDHRTVHKQQKSIGPDAFHRSVIRLPSCMPSYFLPPFMPSFLRVTSLHFVSRHVLPFILPSFLIYSLL
jgi:hypothetical protein